MGGDNYLLAVTVCRSVDMHIDYVHQLLMQTHGTA